VFEVKRFHFSALATAAVLAGVVGGTAAVGASPHGPTSGISRGTISRALPTPGAAARIRAAGLDDGPEASSDDGGGLPAGGAAGHGTIGTALPTPGAASRIRALGLDD
jgi:hypothetical protein